MRAETLWAAGTAGEAGERRGEDPLRVVLYSHDTKGLGHFRRNLHIAEALATGNITVLMIAGVREAGSFSMPDGVDCITLPAYSKDLDGRYGSRHLAVPLDDLRALREQTIRASVSSFDPDVLIVDYAPRGGLEELMPTLEALGPRTVRVLGLRDILGEPGFVARNWARAENEPCIRQHFDELWIYGDKRIYDTVREYDLPPDIAAMTRYAGYVCGDREDHVEPDLTGLYDLCCIGGGQDGGELALAFAAAKRPRPGVILAGPFLPESVRQELEHFRGRDLHIVDFTTHPTGWILGAERVIAMGGYNTFVEIIEAGKTALVVPRLNSRQEQILRAERFAELGIVDRLDPRDLSADAISHWLNRDVPAPPSLEGLVDLSGASRLHDLLTALVSSPRRAATAA